MLDVEWAHAMAPNAKITLVEGCTNQTLIWIRLLDRGKSRTWFPIAGATASSVASGLPIYVHFAEVPIQFSSGDGGAAAHYPCRLPTSPAWAEPD